MTVVGYDATHANVLAIPAAAKVVMGYDTGSPDIRWTEDDWALFPSARRVHIDQGFTGSPSLTATVRDVERGAWDAHTAVTEMAGWVPDRPTIYCNMNTLPAVLTAGWDRDLWLAIPSDSPPTEPPRVKGCTVVAVQFRFGEAIDLSAVFDDTWPHKPAAPAGVRFPAPVNVHQIANVALEWDDVKPVSGRKPTGYTVQVRQLNGVKVLDAVVTVPRIVIPRLRVGWQYDALVWANGGDIAPPGATFRITP